MDSFFKTLRQYFLKTDLCLLITAIFSSVFGIVLIYSATHNGENEKYILIQTVACLMGIAAFSLFSLIDIERLSDFWIYFLVVNILLLVSLVLFGVEGGTGNKSWIRFGTVGIQPAEFGKVIFIFTLSKHMSLLRKNISSITSVLQLLIHIFGFAAVIYVVSKDMGMALVYVLIGVAMLFAAGTSIKWFAAGGAFCAAMLPVFWHFLGDIQKNRILVLIDPSVAPATAWQTEQSKIAIGAGQLMGKGYLQGNQTQLGRLPARHTDCIFAVAGEEFGFFGCVAIIILLTILIVRVFYVSWKADSSVSQLVCVGIGAMLLFQSVINIGMCVGLTPVIGLTLPFFSYGGSSILTMFTSIGIVSGVKMRIKPVRLK